MCVSLCMAFTACEKDEDDEDEEEEEEEETKKKDEDDEDGNADFDFDFDFDFSGGEETKAETAVMETEAETKKPEIDTVTGEAETAEPEEPDGYISRREREEIVRNYGSVYVEINVKDYGTVRVELYADVAPVTVKNFITLAESGFYNGISFHRIVEDFVIQAGDPTGTGYGGSEENIYGEFSANGVENDLSHKRGVISMARTASDMNSASSQFFICTEDSEFLDGQYAAFGCVIDGMDVVDAIDEVQTDAYGRPYESVVIESVTVYHMVEF